MKKHLLTITMLVLVLCILSTTAFAAGKLVATKENFHVLDAYSVYGYAFAKVENTGDKPVEFSAGLLEMYDANGDTLTSTDYLHCYPEYLEPGEYGYVFAYDNVEDASAASEVDDYMLTVTGKSTDGAVVRYPVTGDYQKEVQVSKYSSYDFVVAEITNNTDKTVYNMQVVVVLLDDEDNILYMDNNSYYNSTGINAGSTITYRSSIGDDWYKTWEREGVTPTHADVIAYTEVVNF